MIDKRGVLRERLTSLPRSRVIDETKLKTHNSRPEMVEDKVIDFDDDYDSDYFNSQYQGGENEEEDQNFPDDITAKSGL